MCFPMIPILPGRSYFVVIPKTMISSMSPAKIEEDVQVKCCKRTLGVRDFVANFGLSLLNAEGYTYYLKGLNFREVTSVSARKTSVTKYSMKKWYRTHSGIRRESKISS